MFYIYIYIKDIWVIFDKRYLGDIRVNHRLIRNQRKECNIHDNVGVHRFFNIIFYVQTFFTFGQKLIWKKVTRVECLDNFFLIRILNVLCSRKKLHDQR